MDLFWSWLAFPLALAAASLGCGLLLERLARVRMPGALLVPAGIATLIVAGHFSTATDATAELTAPLIVCLAVAGFAVSSRWRVDRPDPWVILPAVTVFAIYGAPIILSGEATFAGYIRLDDTATWLALTDRVMEYGHSLDGLAPSTYEATLAFNLGDGYPVGVFIPLGVGSVLTGIDSAWLIQPYMSVAAACVALCLWEILEPLVPRRPLRAAAAAVGAQPALLVGYVQWGGVKEVVAAALIALFVALIPRVAAVRPPRGWIIVLGVAVGALLAVLSLGGAVWVLLALAGVAGLLWGRLGAVGVLRRAGALAIVVAALSLPLLVPALLDGNLLPPTSSPLTSGTAKGNLIEPLGLERLFGIWPAGDFRLDAVDGGVAAVLIVVAAGSALVGLWYAIRSDALGMALYGGGVLAACLFLVAIGSPWVDGKAMAIASPALLALAAGGAAAAIARGRGVGGGLALAAIAVGALWSNVLAYRDANLAPRDQLAELEQIGEAIAGQGPTLMTEYQPYGARHFLREADPEAVSELRRRRVPLRGGGTVEKGFWADTDDLELAGLTTYRTLVLRRSPVRSRPPNPYALRFSGDYYEVWQRPEPRPAVAAHLGLGDDASPIGRARCVQVRELAAGVGEGGSLLAARRAPVITAPGAPPHGIRPESLVARPPVRVAGRYEVWLRGSVRSGAELLVDDREAGSIRHLLNNAGQWMLLGEARLESGRHRIEVRFGETDLHPGSGGAVGSLGPLVLSRAGAADSRVTEVRTDRFRELCGRRLDWIEALR